MIPPWPVEWILEEISTGWNGGKPERPACRENFADSASQGFGTHGRLPLSLHEMLFSL